MFLLRMDFKKAARMIHLRIIVIIEQHLLQSNSFVQVKKIFLTKKRAQITERKARGRAL